ncbi:MAG: glycoside hydrolase family 127 protein [Clostridia bacterium]|nr:glycoside hydrolase family 127 protein [Clostridia bacterium]
MSIKQVSFRDVNILDGFWKDRQKLNHDVTIHSVRDRFKDTGRFEAFKFNWEEGKPNKPHFFWDSDVAKWLESVAYIIEKEPDPLLESQVDEVVDLIEKYQEENGYFNIYFTVCEPDKRFSNRDWHELYCAGHLMEAAVAYYNATGKDKFLKCMCKYADLIEKIFKIEDSAAFHTPGHEEIELALVKLYHCTGEKRYLDLSKHFVDKRGCEREVPESHWANDIYYQSEKPCREMTEANGHSVRACYLYAGMADIAREFEDEELKNACKTIFDSIYYKKMYVTAGLGQSYHGEGFTVPYDLQNDVAYTETCASIALVYFASRMQQLELNSKYGDVIERAIYNGILSGVSLDGKSFFYENPLEIMLSEHNRNIFLKNDKERRPITQRLEVFGCSCCPPNITRFIPSIGDYIYGADDETVYVHQFISSDAKINGIDISMKSGYPYDGKISIKIQGGNGKMLAFRIPSYSKDSFTALVNGKNAELTIKNGYAFVKLNSETEISITFDISPKKVFANPLVDRDAGKCAILAGPLVYCAEGKDNGSHLRMFRVPETLDYKFSDNAETGTKTLIIKAEKMTASDDLYSFNRTYEETELKLIPYFAFANRGETDMAVWLISK